MPIVDQRSGSWDRRLSMQLTPEAIFEAVSQLSEGERLTVISRLLEMVPADDIAMSLDDPTIAEELDRRFADPRGASRGMNCGRKGDGRGPRPIPSACRPRVAAIGKRQRGGIAHRWERHRRGSIALPAGSRFASVRQPDSARRLRTPEDFGRFLAGPGGAVGEDLADAGSGGPPGRGGASGSAK